MIGQAFSMAVVTLMLTIYIGKTAITAEYHPHLLQSMKTSFVIFAILCSLGVIASLVRGKIRKDEGPPK